MWNISLNGVYKKRKIRKSIRANSTRRRNKEGELDRAKHLAKKEGWSKGKIEKIAQD